MEIHMRKLYAVVALMFLAACGGSDSPTAPATASFAGTYTLRSVNGTSLPYILVQTGVNKLEVMDDTFTLNDGGTWTESGHLRTTTNGQATTTSLVDAGTYTRNGTSITLSSPTTGAVSGSVSNGSLSVSESGAAFVYTK